MQELKFESMGTAWSVLADSADLTEEARQAILDYAGGFDRRFSRFLPDSEANAFRNSPAGTYTVSEEFAALLRIAKKLEHMTAGRFNAAVGGLFERVGYGGARDTLPEDDVSSYSLPVWSLEGREITIDCPVVFDVGGFGKGYAIDRTAELLKNRGFEHLLVDGGGDMYGTRKRGGEPWRVAIQHPGKEDTAAGMLELIDAGLAVSDTFRRRWGAWHHIIDAKGKKPVRNVIGCAAVASSACDADCATSLLFLASSETYPAVACEFGSKYLIFQSDGSARMSPGWPGELYE